MMMTMMEEKRIYIYEQMKMGHETANFSTIPILKVLVREMKIVEESERESERE